MDSQISSPARGINERPSERTVFGSANTRRYWFNLVIYRPDDQRLLCLARTLRGDRRLSSLWFNTQTNSFEPALQGLLPKDGHPAFSSDGRYLVCDSYPGRPDRYARLIMVNLGTAEARQLGAFYSEPLFSGDIRCDLHPRWSRDNRSITFDSVHEGDRQIYRIDLE